MPNSVDTAGYPSQDRSKDHYQDGRDARSGLAAPRVRLGEDRGRRALLVQGVVQSVALEGPGAREGYWGRMLPDVRPTRALILGYGGGTLAHLLHDRFGPLQIVVVLIVT